jgi:hypothetical protein
MIVLSALLGIFAAGFKLKVLGGIDSTTFSGSLWVTLLTGIVFTGLLLFAGYLLKVKEIREMINRVRVRLTGSSSR